MTPSLTVRELRPGRWEIRPPPRRFEWAVLLVNASTAEEALAKAHQYITRCQSSRLTPVVAP